MLDPDVSTTALHFLSASELDNDLDLQKVNLCYLSPEGLGLVKVYMHMYNNGNLPSLPHFMVYPCTD